jgi:hypothetical protein
MSRCRNETVKGRQEDRKKEKKRERERERKKKRSQIDKVGAWLVDPQGAETANSRYSYLFLALRVKQRSKSSPSRSTMKSCKMA